MASALLTTGRQDWSTPLTPHLRIQSHSAAGPHPRVTFRLTVQAEHLNGLGNLHGGCAATLFDVCTSLVVHLVARPGFWSALGVTRTLNVVCLRPAPRGQVVDLECAVVQIGRRLCALRAVMRAVDGPDGPEGEGAVLMTCEHGKVNTDAVAQA